jgi:hypothetical protein
MKFCSAAGREVGEVGLQAFWLGQARRGAGGVGGGGAYGLSVWEVTTLLLCYQPLTC